MSAQELAGKVALVTGAGSGNGAAIAESLAAAGAQTWLLDRDAAGIDATIKGWDFEVAQRAHAVTADVTIDAQVNDAFAALDRLDILVNNAGVVDGGTFPTMEVSAFDKVLDVNLLGAYRCARAAYDLLIASGHGRVINITSMEAHHLLSTGGHVQPHYNASKAALDLLTKALAYEFAPSGVTVNAVAPGVIETPFTAGSLANTETANWIIDRVPVGRFGRPEDIAAVVTFLASEGAAFVTGASIPVDGGLTLGWFNRSTTGAAV